MMIKECNQLINWFGRNMYMRNKKDLIQKKEETQCNNIIKKQWLTLMILQNKTLKNIIQLGCKFLTIRTEYQ